MPQMDQDGVATDFLSRHTRQVAIERQMPMDEVTDEYAAMRMAIALMRGDPKTLKQGYSRENAVIAVLEVMPTVDREELQLELDRFLQ